MPYMFLIALWQLIFRILKKGLKNAKPENCGRPKNMDERSRRLIVRNAKIQAFSSVKALWQLNKSGVNNETLLRQARNLGFEPKKKLKTARLTKAMRKNRLEGCKANIFLISTRYYFLMKRIWRYKKWVPNTVYLYKESQLNLGKFKKKDKCPDLGVHSYYGWWLCHCVS